MRALLIIVYRSALYRSFGLGLVVLTIALATTLLVSLERVRRDVRENFSQSVSGTDLIVGARTGPVQLLLYAVFRIGQATNNIRWQSVQMLTADPNVAWVIPIALGDTHRGYPVVATTPAFYEHFRYGAGQSLQLRLGRPVHDVFDAVLGAEVAEQLGYALGQSVVLRHGDGPLASNDHADKPFTIVGVLARTGTPVDRSVHISLEGMEAMHLDWVMGVPLPGFKLSAEQARQQDLTPKSVTAALVGLHQRAGVFALQRRIQTYQVEPLMAILPGVTLDALWDVVGQAERALQWMSVMVAAVSLLGLVAVVLTALEQRRRELAVLRSLGVGPWRMVVMLIVEAALVTGLGLCLGLLAWALLFSFGAPWVAEQYGIHLHLSMLTWPEVTWLGAIMVAGVLASLLPGWRAYRLSLADGLAPRVA